MNYRIKWLFYTVLVGLLPLFVRFTAWCLHSAVSADAIDMISVSDIVYFGLVLHISIINEIEHLDYIDKNKKTIQNGTSIIFIVFYSALYAFSLSPNSFLPMRVLGASLFVVPFSLYLGYSIYSTISKS